MTETPFLVTGSNGFIGASLRQFLADRDVDSLGVVRSRVEGRAPGVVTIPYDQPDVLRRLLEVHGVRTVVHAVGSASVGASMTDPFLDFDANVATVASVLEAARSAAHDVEVVLLSSAAVYGAPDSLPIAESAATRPLSAYGYHKLAAEVLAEGAADVFSQRVTVLRIFSVLGPRQRRLLPFELWSQAVGGSEAIRLHGTGEESRDYVHIDDLCEVVHGLSLSDRGAGFECFNVGSGTETSVRALALEIRDRWAPEKEVVFGNASTPGDPPRWAADVTLLRSALPTWSPRDLVPALEDCAKHWGEQDPRFGGSRA